MAEAEEVITDVARHATVFARDLWRRHRRGLPGPKVTGLRDVAPRLDLLLSAVFGRSFLLRIAEPPAPATFLTKVFRQAEGPRVTAALPATDGHSIWLPALLPDQPGFSGLEQFRVLALQQAQRASRGGAAVWPSLQDRLEQAVFLLLEAQAADAELVRQLPGTATALHALRRMALAQRPALALFPAHRAPLEALVRSALAADIAASPVHPLPDCVARAREVANELRGQGMRPVKGRLLYRDLWTGELRAPLTTSVAAQAAEPLADDDERGPPRSARMSRRPEVREAPEDEDDEKQGAFMVQTAAPHEQAEDPIGLQRPTDRDEATAAQELADSLSELPEARLVSSPGRPKEVLLSDEPPEARAGRGAATAAGQGHALHYPEWDCAVQAYRERGVTVHVGTAPEGPQAWVDATLDQHRSTINLVKRRFEMLKARRVRVHKQLEGDEIDLDAYIAAYADFRAGHPMLPGLYQSCRQARRDMAIVLLADISGSTDGWVGANKRVIDVEREALLLVSIALQGMAEPNAILAFSGEGPHGVVIRVVKPFDEPFGAAVARRIASLEPEHYTRAGAAIRHATAVLMQQPARHRLLLMLSDGKPNDIDDYEGRYGAEDMRQAVTEARLQGIQPFCLTVDRQAAAYMPGIFGAHQYALLPRPELLPTVLLDWMRRLLQAS
ncbi:nitric oxide reductase activation protein NorD [Ideonella sp.]|uniref:nitric oxide reductase activation protein NorD n=1 Tax=Ideonella sp. TaxID=1929293 RepID=UPI0035AF48D6